MQKPPKKLVAAVAAVLAAWAFFRVAGALRPFSETAVRAANAPFGRFFAAVPRAAATLWESVAGGVRTVRENSRLRAENERLAAEALGAAAVRAENAELRRELGLAAGDSRLVAAQVLSEGGGAGWNGTLRIDRGALDGVVPGCPVVAPDGLVGRVVSSTERTADVLPLTDPNCRLSCVVDGFGRAGHGIVSGGGLSRPDGTLQLVHVVEPLEIGFLDKDIAISPGSRVFTAGDGGVFPAGIVVGSVVDASRDSTLLFQRARVKPAVDFRSLRRVFVRTPEDDPAAGPPAAAGAEAAP